MKKIIKNKKSNNLGFSLLEVLLAVVLLAIVVTPLIQTVYTSMSLNKKARILMGATDVGQTYMEYLESMTYDDIVATYTTDTFTIQDDHEGFIYNCKVSISPLLSGTYSVYEVKMDVYYLKNNDPSNEIYQATFKGSVFNKLD